MGELSPIAAPRREGLGHFPTPVTRAGFLWVKRDDQTSPLYGGNKVRKLESFFAAAREEGKRRILTLGAVGSHQVLATAIFGAKLGFVVDAVVVPQPDSPHARATIRAALAHGLRAIPAKNWAAAPFAVLANLGRDSLFIPLGGSNALGSLGFVDAARELAAQVVAGDLPEPEVVVVAVGSGGTAAGLAVGFELLGTKTRIVGVAIAEPAFALGSLAKRLAIATGRRVGLSWMAAKRAADRIEMDTSWLGEGYGHPTEAGARATSVAAAQGLVLDPTYTAKAFACALAREERTVLYWHTLSAPLKIAQGILPKDVESLLRHS